MIDDAVAGDAAASDEDDDVEAIPLDEEESGDEQPEPESRVTPDEPPSS